MAKNAVDVAKKSRVTKLSKKSSDELIQIIIRKDDVEKRLTENVTNLKKEVNNLQTCITNLKKDMQGTEAALSEARENYKLATDEIVATRAKADDAYKAYVRELSLHKFWQKATCVASVIAVLAIFCAIIF